MPCNCDHLYPTQLEEESAKVVKFLKEIDPKLLSNVKYDSNYGNVSVIDEDTATLCEHMGGLSKESVGKLSLELQIWWRDHQAADAKKAAAKIKQATKEVLKKQAIAKLTTEEKEALGLK